MTFTLATLAGLAAERLAVVARPPKDEPSPAAAGATVAEWAAYAGLDCTPHPTIAGRFPDPLDCTPHDRENVAQVAMHRLCARGIVDGLAGLPRRYRPRNG